MGPFEVGTAIAVTVTVSHIGSLEACCIKTLRHVNDAIFPIEVNQLPLMSQYDC